MENNGNPEDILNILIASDVHLGYMEKDPERGEDSYRTFEEILQIAKKREVDFILLGGDLFHEAKPSQNCLHEATSLFRRYCMGDRPVSVEFLSDQAENFQHSVNPIVNFEDPHINISIPVFSIHGNHDDPTGFGRRSSLDLLSAFGLVNYFGKWTDLKQITISPLLMRKGATKLALYGLSYIKDERLSRLFRDKKVQLYQPKEDTDDWFSIFVLHQNRADRGMNKSLPEDVLPKFINLILWGHEHECRIIPERNPIQNYDIIQPGSPVATSLCEGEEKPKHVGILKIYKNEYEFEPIRLKTVRPFVMDTIVLSQINIPYVSNNIKEAIKEFLTGHVNYMIEKAKEQISGDRKQPVLPLIRLRVEFNNDEQMFNPLAFGLQFNTDVANHRDIILFKRERVKKEPKDTVDLDKDTMKNILDKAREVEKVETVVEKYFMDVDQEKGLQVLSVKGLNAALSRFIEQKDLEAIPDLISKQLEKTAVYLKENVDDTDKIKETLEHFRSLRMKSDIDTKDAQQILSDPNRKVKSSLNNDDVMTLTSDSDDEKSISNQQTVLSTQPGRGRGRGRGARGGSNTSRATARGATKGKKQLDVNQTKITSTLTKKQSKMMEWSNSD